MKALDLYCGGGGASMGLKNAGFDVVGVDLNPMPEYPFMFIQKDIFKLPLEFYEQFDFIWASPPCQNYSVGTKGLRNKGKEYPDLIKATRNLLEATNKPYVIENVPYAPIRKDLMLCGTMFNLPLIRHRHFEIKGFKARQPKHEKHKISVMDGTAIMVSRYTSPGCFGNNKKRVEFRKKYSELYKDIKTFQRALGITHIKDRNTLAEAIPPKYAEYIAKEFIKQRKGEKA